MPHWSGTASRLDRNWPRHVAPAPIQFVACDPDQVVPPCEHVIDHRIDMPTPTLDERRRLWKANIPESAAWPADELETLAARYRLNAGDIVSVARRAPASAREAAAFARELTRHWLGELGRLLDCPFTWDDLVVPDKLREALEDFAFEAWDRATFWECPSARRLFPRGRGLVALFSGPPGTGKTMAAQIIAADLELDLFRIDLATRGQQVHRRDRQAPRADLCPRLSDEWRAALRRGRRALQQAHRSERFSRPLRQCGYELLAAIARRIPRHRHPRDQQEAEHRPRFHSPGALRVRVSAARRGRAADGSGAR